MSAAILGPADWLIWVVSMAVLTLSLSLALWWWLAPACFPATRLLGPDPRQPAAVWGLLDLLVMIGSWILIEGLSAAVLASMPPVAQLVGRAASQLLALWVMIRWLHLRYRVTLGDLGIARGRVADDIRLGLLVSLVAIPPVLLVQRCLVEIVPYQHSTKDMIEAGGGLFIALGAFLSAGIMAPLIEEFLYRWLLQGWLSRLASAGPDAAPLVFLGGRDSAAKASPAGAQAGGPRQRGTANGAARDSTPRRLPMWPVLISAALFAVAHLGQGPAPIPLFVLALALGYLALRTQRIVASLVVHLVLNWFSLSLLVYAMLWS